MIFRYKCMAYSYCTLNFLSLEGECVCVFTDCSLHIMHWQKTWLYWIYTILLSLFQPAPTGEIYSDISYKSVFTPVNSREVCASNFERQSIFAPFHHAILVKFEDLHTLNGSIAIYGSRSRSRRNATELAVQTGSSPSHDIISYWPYLFLGVNGGEFCSNSKFKVVVSVWNISGGLH